MWAKEQKSLETTGLDRKQFWEHWLELLPIECHNWKDFFLPSFPKSFQSFLLLLLIAINWRVRSETCLLSLRLKERPVAQLTQLASTNLLYLCWKDGHAKCQKTDLAKILQDPGCTDLIGWKLVCTSLSSTAYFTQRRYQVPDESNGASSRLLCRNK